MSKRKTKFISINISAGVFPTYEESQKEADAIKQWIIRLCEKNGYSCRAIIGISKNNPNTKQPIVFSFCIFILSMCYNFS